MSEEERNRKLLARLLWLFWKGQRARLKLLPSDLVVDVQRMLVEILVKLDPAQESNIRAGTGKFSLD